MSVLRFLIAILFLCWGLNPVLGQGGTEVSLLEGKLALSWSSESDVFQIERTSFLVDVRWDLIASRVTGGSFSIDVLEAAAFFRVTRVGRRIESLAFGCDLDVDGCLGPRFPPWCFGVRSIKDWKEPGDRSASVPLKFDFWQRPYQNKAGFDAVKQINTWFADGESAGLGQDAFRSFDSGHSTIRDFYPQLRQLPPLESYDAECRDVFAPGVTFGVQSLAASADILGEGLSVIDFYSATELLYHYNPTEYRRLIGAKSPVFTRAFYRQLFESNVLLISPAVKSFQFRGDEVQDRFYFLSPYYLHSIGLSGSDSQLLKPLIFAAASLPRELKTRILRNGMQTPVLMWLFRFAMNDDLDSVESHVPAFLLPAEADRPAPELELRDDGARESLTEAYERVGDESAPFLDALLEAARGLQHIPPVARIRHLTAPMVSGGDYSIEAFVYSDPYTVQAVLRPGERLELELDLTQSWTDEGILAGYDVQLLRDPGSGTETVIDSTRIEEGRTRLSIPWQQAEPECGRRTDVSLQVNDGRVNSVPAYISVRHLQEDDRDRFDF